MFNLYLLLMLIALPLLGVGLRWLRYWLADQPLTLRGIERDLRRGLQGATAESLAGLLGWFLPAFGFACLLTGDVLAAVLALEAAPLAVVAVQLFAGNPWAQVGAARRLQLYALATFGYFAALTVLLRDGTSWQAVTRWEGEGLELAAHGLAAVVILFALPGRMAAHPFAAGEDAERLANRRAETTPAVLALLTWEAALTLFAAALLIPPLVGGLAMQVGAILLAAVLLTGVVGLISRRSSVRVPPASANEFYFRYNLFFAVALLIMGVVVSSQSLGVRGLWRRWVGRGVMSAPI